MANGQETTSATSPWLQALQSIIGGYVETNKPNVPLPTKPDIVPSPNKNYFGSVNKNYVIIGGITSLVLISLAFVMRKK